ncbi:MAG: aldehyde dehydrogenase family protein [Rhodospirillales bacterium]|nr:aldehyde dehydrogenase family protein [Rhodospirillales bacterium]
MKSYSEIFVDGEWSRPSGTNTIDVVNPTTEAVCGRIPACDANDAERAVLAARGAFNQWSRTPKAERIEYLLKIHQGLKERAGEIAKTITDEVGMPLKLSAMIQAGSPIGQFKGMARTTEAFSFEEEVGNSRIIREAVGVTVCITPWNYPLHQIAAKVAPALAAGCTVVLKPSEVAPLNAFILAEVIESVGLPKGVFNLVTGTGTEIGEPLVAHPEVDMISFTGSTGAGRAISAVAAQTIKRVTLELGGKSAAIVLEDADLTKAIKGIFGACYINSGQTCTAHTRLLVPESKYEEAKTIAKKVAESWTVADPNTENARLGPLVSKDQWERVQSFISKGQQEGAELISGGEGKPEGLETGFFVKPTVFGQVNPKSTIAQEEIFGPVMSIITYQTEEEAVSIANDSIYGLSGGVWSEDQEKAIEIAKQLRTGMVDINGGNFNPAAPFGGYKQSGNGREFGSYGLEEFLEFKAIQL